MTSTVRFTNLLSSISNSWLINYGISPISMLLILAILPAVNE